MRGLETTETPQIVLQEQQPQLAEDVGHFVIRQRALVVDVADGAPQRRLVTRHELPPRDRIARQHSRQQVVAAHHPLGAFGKMRSRKKRTASSTGCARS